MKNIIYLILIALFAGVACKKNTEDENGRYIVSASKIMNLTSSNWQETEPRLMNRPGYQFTEAPFSIQNDIKGTVYLPAIDEHSRIDAGYVQLTVLKAGIVINAAYQTEPLSQSQVYDMMLNYHAETLQVTLTARYLVGLTVVNGVVGSELADSVLAILRRGQVADQLTMTYKINGQYPTFSFGVRRQTDGRYTFNYSGR